MSDIVGPTEIIEVVIMIEGEASRASRIRRTRCILGRYVDVFQIHEVMIGPNGSKLIVPGPILKCSYGDDGLKLERIG